MSDTDPYFFIKEFSNEQLTKILAEKIKELKLAKEQSDEINLKLQNKMAELEEVQNDLAIQRDHLQSEIMRQTQEMLKTERLSTIGNLAARIAHDLRNPLSVIQSTSQILKLKLDVNLDDKTREQWARLDRAVYRMSHSWRI